jgi:hypothetical protein
MTRPNISIEVETNRDVRDARIEAGEALDQVRDAVIAQRRALLTTYPKTGPVAAHDRRAINRLGILIVEIDRTLLHLRRAAGQEREP